MMRARIVTLAPLALLLILVLAATVQGQSGFIIDRADATSYLSMAGSSELNTLISAVQTRYVVQYANALRILSMAPIIPSELQTLLGQVGTRFILQYANANRIYPMGYPQALIGDTLAPLITEIVATGIDGERVRIVWTTDEFADSTVTYGTQSGVYTGTASDASYVKRHEVILSNIPAGTTLYFRVSSTDRSGNEGQSAEQRYTVQTPVYVPIVLKQR